MAVTYKGQPAEEYMGELRAAFALNRVPAVQKTASVFFGQLVRRLVPIATSDVDTMAVDGVHLFYNPDFLVGIPVEQAFGVLAHEGIHVGLAHHARRKGRDIRLWNIACDLAINYLLSEAGFALPEEGLFPGRGAFAGLQVGLSAEEYYEALRHQEQEQQQQQEQEQEQQDDEEEKQSKGGRERKSKPCKDIS